MRREVDGVLKPTVLRPPFYGLLMFQQAVGAGSLMLSKVTASGDTSYVKLWPLKDASSGELRFVMINKHPTQAATQVVRLAGANSGRVDYDSMAQLSRLVAQGDQPLLATEGITIAGRYFVAGLEQRGTDQTLLLDADGSPGNELVWSVYLPPGSATLMRIKPRSAAV